MLVLRSCGRSGRREVGSLEVCSGEGGDVVTNARTEFGERFLNLGWVIVSLSLVDLCDPR